MSKRILVVEDQPDNRQIIRDMLAPTDYEITEAEDGQQALETITKQRPDLILMDSPEANNDSFYVSARGAGPGIFAPNDAEHRHDLQRADRGVTEDTGSTGLGL